MDVDRASVPADPTPVGLERPSESRTFLIADIRGYTRFTDEHGDEAAAALAARFADLVRRVIEDRGGVLVEVRGDEALTVFASARQALRAAVDVQARVRDEGLPRGVGIGLDSGEAVPVDGGFRGAALNVASRLCAQARPGEILASETVVRLAARVEGISYSSTRTLRLKGVEHPVRAVSVRAVPDPSAAGGGSIVGARPRAATTRRAAVVGAALALAAISGAAAIWFGRTAPGATPDPTVAGPGSSGPVSGASPPPSPSGVTGSVPAPDVPTAKGNVGRTNLMPGPGPDPSSGGLVARLRFEAPSELSSSPAVAGDRIYVGDRGGLLHVLDLRTGKEEWTYDAGAPVRTTPTVVDGVAYVTTETGELHAIDLSSHARRWLLGGVAPAAVPAVNGNVVYIGLASGSFTARSAADGEERWSVEIGGDGSMVALRPGTAYVASTGQAVLIALDLATGSIRWRTELPSAPLMSPAVSGGAVFTVIDGAGDRDEVYAVLANTGRESWRWSPPEPASLETLIVTDRLVYTGAQIGDGTAFWAVDRFSGELEFPRRLKDPAVGSTAVGETLYVAGADGTVRAIAASDGDGIELWAVQVPGPTFGDPVVTGGLVLVVTGPGEAGTGGIWAIGPSGGPGASADPDPWEWVADLTAGDDQRALYLNVAIDADGKVYAADRLSHRVVIWDAAGKPEVWGKFGTDPGEFDFGGVTEGDQSQSVAIAADGRIAVGDGGNHRVQIFDSRRRFMIAVGREGRGPAQFVNPCCVAFDGQGRLYVADAGRHDIQIFDVDGRFLRIIGEFGRGEGQFDRLGVPYIDPKTGLLWVPDFANDRVEVVDSEGNFVVEYKVGQGGGPSFTGVNGVVLDEAGRLFVVDDGDNNLVWVLDSDGTVITRLGPQIPGHGSIGPTYLALTVDGRLYLPDGNGSRVVVMQLLPPVWPPPTG